MLCCSAAVVVSLGPSHEPITTLFQNVLKSETPAPTAAPSSEWRRNGCSVKKLATAGAAVSPTPAELTTLCEAKFDFIQVHFPNETSFIEVVGWLDYVPSKQLWLAPRLQPGRELDVAFVPLGDTFLIDTYHPTASGGTGQSGDWKAFSQLRQKYKRVTWVLAGGLNPDNIGGAIIELAPYGVDVSTGVEKSAGVKDINLMKRFVENVRKV